MAAGFDPKRLALTGSPTEVLAGVGRGDGLVGMLAVSASGTLLYKRSSESEQQVVRVTRDGRSTPVDPAWTGALNSLSLSPDGTRLAMEVMREGGGIEIWVRSSQGSAHSAGSRRYRLLQASLGTWWPVSYVYLRRRRHQPTADPSVRWQRHGHGAGPNAARNRRGSLLPRRPMADPARRRRWRPRYLWSAARDRQRSRSADHHRVRGALPCPFADGRWLA